jgi:hypothetical protein
MTKAQFFHPDQLTAIRTGCDWRKLLDDLGVRADVKRCTASEYWGYSPFQPEEKTASFHMKAPGIWYDWPTHATAPGRSKPGGGVIELVQAVFAMRGQVMKLNEAAGWIVDHGYSRAGEPSAPPEKPEDETVKENRPIEIDLVPRLGDHAEFAKRGISEVTRQYLHCGYLDEARGMLAKRLVFQVSGLAGDGESRAILSHMGRATTPEQEEKGKWRFYRGFNPSLELYNLDNVLLDKEAARQIIETKRIVVVEGAFDVAKCVEAGIKNVVASFGARVSKEQAVKLGDALTRLSASRVIIFYDRDKAGRRASGDALKLFSAHGTHASAFDWEQNFASSGQTPKSIPETIQDPCDFTVTQLRWLRERGIV